MGTGGFNPGEVRNRRVSGHIADLMPDNTSARSEYYFGGERVLPTGQVPGNGDAGVCRLEVYVGGDGQFEVHEARRFDPDAEHGWRCTNRIARTESAGARSLDPFEYHVRTTLTIGGQERADRATVAWETLGSDLIYGGLEAQAATLLAEKVAHRIATDDEGFTSHPGSLSGYGSLSRIVDNGRPLDVDWEAVGDLLGPDADTIAASSGVESLASDERRERAKQRGIDFLGDDLEAELAETKAAEGDWRTLSDAAPVPEDAREPWQTLPGDVCPVEAEARLAEMRETIRELRADR